MGRRDEDQIEMFQAVSPKVLEAARELAGLLLSLNHPETAEACAHDVPAEDWAMLTLWARLVLGREREEPTVEAAPQAAPEPEEQPIEGACLVPLCTKKSTAQHLCSTHYRKARKLGFDTSALTGEQLLELSKATGRKPRG